jgi:hypothetical protein
MIERSDTTNPKSLRGVGPYGPSGPEAAIQNLRFSSIRWFNGINMGEKLRAILWAAFTTPGEIYQKKLKSAP